MKGVLLAVLASIYGNGDGYAYKKTANGEIMNPKALTAAHRTYPFDTIVNVINLKNGKEVMVRINDRGPYKKGRAIDVTPAVAEALGFDGLTPVELKVVELPPQKNLRLK